MATLGGKVDKAILGIIGLVVLFKLYAVLVPEAQTAGTELVEVGYGNDTSANVSSIPLAGLFSANGIVFLIIMVALLTTIISSFMKKNN